MRLDEAAYIFDCIFRVARLGREHEVTTTVKEGIAGPPLIDGAVNDSAVDVS